MEGEDEKRGKWNCRITSKQRMIRLTWTALLQEAQRGSRAAQLRKFVRSCWCYLRRRRETKPVPAKAIPKSMAVVPPSGTGGEYETGMRTNWS